MPVRPSSLYGLSKSFGENLSRLFYDRYGIETVCLRIAMCFPEPTTHRMLRSYLSYDDLKSLVERALLAPDVGHAIVYGVSNNRDLLWRNPDAARIGWTPKDSSERVSRERRGATRRRRIRTTCRIASTAAASRRTGRSRIATAPESRS